MPAQYREGNLQSIAGEERPGSGVVTDRARNPVVCPLRRCWQRPSPSVW